MLRTHTCGELSKKEDKKEVRLAGWVNTRRDHGGVIFIDLRDRYGFTQITFNPDNKAIFDMADKLRREDCVGITGKVRLRPKGMENPKMATGEVEVLASNLEIFNKSETPPMEIDDRIDAGDDLRLQYRYLDLRRPVMQRNLLARHNFITAVRSFLNKQSFLEIETPILVKSTPEGARDYVVPSRVSPGKFYALPQSPQLYKQLLMIANFDKYYQIAKCLRDEDLRADRQPEHTQIDFEMSFVEQEDIRKLVEDMFVTVFKEVFDIKIKAPLPLFTHKESMDKYATDKPDIRYELFVTDVSDIVKDSDFGVFKSVVESGGIVKAINPVKELGRKEIDAYIEFAQQHGAKGLAWMRVTEDKKLESNIAKYFKEDVQKKLVERLGAKPKSVLMFIADKPKAANAVLDKLRRKLAEDLKLYKNDDFKFCWVNDFPLFAWNEDDNRWIPEHHMFSMPKKEFLDRLEDKPGEVLGDLWDLTLNGWEIGSGSIRISNPDIQRKIMKIVGMSEAEAQEKFGFLLDAYKYAGPIHGGMGLGIARVLTLALGYDDIREVIAFPKNKAAECPMDGSPGYIEEKQLKELHLKLDKKQ